MGRSGRRPCRMLGWCTWLLLLRAPNSTAWPAHTKCAIERHVDRTPQYVLPRFLHSRSRWWHCRCAPRVCRRRRAGTSKQRLSSSSTSRPPGTSVLEGLADVVDPAVRSARGGTPDRGGVLGATVHVGHELVECRGVV